MNATGSCRGLPEGGRRWKIKKMGGGGETETERQRPSRASPEGRTGLVLCSPRCWAAQERGQRPGNPRPPPATETPSEGRGRQDTEQLRAGDRHGQGAEGRSESLRRGNRSSGCCLPRRAAAQRADILPACPAPCAQRVPALGAGAPPLPPPRKKASGGRAGPFQKQQQRGRAFPQRGAILVPQEPGEMGERREP